MRIVRHQTLTALERHYEIRPPPKQMVHSCACRLVPFHEIEVFFLILVWLSFNVKTTNTLQRRCYTLKSVYKLLFQLKDGVEVHFSSAT